MGRIGCPTRKSDCLKSAETGMGVSARIHDSNSLGDKAREGPGSERSDSSHPFWSAAEGVHVCFTRHTSLDKSSCSKFAAAWNHLSYRVLKAPPFSMQSTVVSMYCAFVTPIPRY